MTAKKAAAKPAAKTALEKATCGTCGSPVDVVRSGQRIEWSCPVCDTKPSVDSDAEQFGFNKYARTEV